MIANVNSSSRWQFVAKAASTKRTFTQKLRAHLDGVALPKGQFASRAVVGKHVLQKAAWRAVTQRSAWRVVRGALVEALLFETTRQNFGTTSILRTQAGFYPHVFMPDYHSPFFEDAVRRLALPGLGPNVMYFSLTGACPCACEYCYASAGTNAPDVGDDPTLEVARQVAQLEIPLVNLSGGEPMTRYKRLLSVVKILSPHSEVRVFTTGIGTTAARAQALKEAGLKGAFVSLDGTDAVRFDAQRGKKGAFKAAIAALKIYAQAGLFTVVNCVVGKHSFATAKEVADFLRFVENIDPQIVVNFIPLLATGRGVQADSFHHPEECEEVADRIVSTSQELRRPIAMLFGRVDTLLGCPGAGGKLINVDIQGNVTVCISKASLGNILRESFDAIYARYVEQCATLKVGFFCCQVAQAADGELVEGEQSRSLLDSYFKNDVDSDWQKILRPFSGLLSVLAMK